MLFDLPTTVPVTELPFARSSIPITATTPTNAIRLNEGATPLFDFKFVNISSPPYLNIVIIAYMVFLYFIGELLYNYDNTTFYMEKMPKLRRERVTIWKVWRYFKLIKEIPRFTAKHHVFDLLHIKSTPEFRYMLRSLGAHYYAYFNISNNDLVAVTSFYMMEPHRSSFNNFEDKPGEVHIDWEKLSENDLKSLGIHSLQELKIILQTSKSIIIREGTIVHTEYRRKGIATYLIKDLEDLLRKRKIDYIYTSTLPENTAMQAVFAKNHYIKILTIDLAQLNVDRLPVYLKFLKN